MFKYSNSKKDVKNGICASIKKNSIKINDSVKVPLHDVVFCFLSHDQTTHKQLNWVFFANVFTFLGFLLLFDV